MVRAPPGQRRHTCTDTNHMSFRDIQTVDDVEAYKKRLNDHYPERSKIISHIIDQIQPLGLDNLTVVELCVGPGQLAEALCRDIPGIHYVGLDFMQPFLDYTERLLPSGATFVCADLTESAWPTLLTEAIHDNRIDLILSMQSLHDVGNADQIGSIYKRSQALLNRGGRLINADFITQEGDEAAARPGRLTVPHHLELLQAAGFTTTGCTLRTAQFGVCFGSNA